MLQTKRKDFLEKESTTALKGICMIMIILHHCYTHTAPMPALLAGIIHIGWWGSIGTGLFFFLSGYGLYISLLRYNDLPWKWIGSKLKKMLIPFVFMFVLFLILFFNEIEWTSDLLLSFIALSSPFGKMWFLKVIVGIYLAVFLVYRYGSKNNFNRIMVLTAICSIYFVCAIIFDLKNYWWTSVLNFPLGLWCGYFVKSKVFQYYITMKYDRIFFVIVLFLLSALVIYQHFSFSYYTHVIIVLLSTLVFIFVIQYMPIISKNLLYIGNNSINFYLFQMPLMYICLAMFSHSYVVWFIIPIGTVLLSLFYQKIELLINRISRNSNSSVC